MKNRNTPSTANAPSPARARVHAFLAVAGIAIALVCALILLQEASIMPHLGTGKLSFGEVSKMTSIFRIAASW